MNIEPNQDPTFLSFQRALGFDNADLRAATERRKASLFRRQQYRLPNMADDYEDAQKNVMDDFAARGISTSGLRIKAQGDVLNRYTRNVGQEQSEYVDQQGELEASLARQIAANQRKLAEESVEARQRLAMQAAAVGQR